MFLWYLLAFLPRLNDNESEWRHSGKGVIINPSKAVFRNHRLAIWNWCRVLTPSCWWSFPVFRWNCSSRYKKVPVHVEDSKSTIPYPCWTSNTVRKIESDQWFSRNWNVGRERVPMGYFESKRKVKGNI